MTEDKLLKAFQDEFNGYCSWECQKQIDKIKRERRWSKPEPKPKDYWEDLSEEDKQRIRIALMTKQI